LNNIGPDGSEVPGAGAGFVVASPSKANPNCKYLQFTCRKIS
jgi:glucoamylase